jgi:ferredoxin-NADP reductase
MAMLRLRQMAMSTVPAGLLYSSRSFEDVIYRDELDRLVSTGSGLEVFLTLTRQQPRSWTGLRRRIDSEMLQAVAWPRAQQPLIFVCGPTPLVEATANALVNLGHEPARIKTERFGPTGG